MNVDRAGWDERYRGEGLVFTADPSSFLGPEVAGLVPGRALDLGSGEGRNALWLAERGWRVTAVDFSETGLAKAQRLAGRRGVEADWMVADLRSLPLPSSTFDLVIQFFVHFPPAQRRMLLSQAAASLRPGGVLLVVGYDVSHLDERSGGGPRDPALLFTVEGLVDDLVDGAGLVLERAERIRLPVGIDDDGSPCFAVDVVVRARRHAG